MPHADSSYFAAGASKDQVYDQVLEQARGLLTGQRNWVSNLANVSSLLWHAYAALPQPSSSVNWAGFYVRDDRFPLLASPQRSNSITGFMTTTITTSYASTEKKLLLGPFQGKPACQEIKFGRGVCGASAEKKETVIVPDVHEFPGHIACDADSRSEIVVPIIFEGETVAIIDIDCAEPAGFDEVDKKYLEKLAQLLSDSSVPPESPVPPWSTPSTNLRKDLTSCTSNHLKEDLSADADVPRSDSCPRQQQPQQSVFDFSFERDSLSSSSLSSPSIVQLPDHSLSSLWSSTSYPVDSAAPESFDQLTGALDFDFLIDHTALAEPEQKGDLSYGLSLDFNSRDQSCFDIATTTTHDLSSEESTSGHTSCPTIHIEEDSPASSTSPSSASASCSPVNMSEGGDTLSHSVSSIDIMGVGMDSFFSTNSAVSTSSATMNGTLLSPLSMSSFHSSRGYHQHQHHQQQQQHHQQQQQQQHLLAPKQQTPPSSSSSSSSSPAFNLIHTVTLDSKTSKKRSSADSTTAGIDLFSNNSGQDSEEDRVVEKRRRNTMAARRFRQRKQDHVSSLESQLSKVIEERDDLKLQVAKWEGEVMALRKLLDMKK